MSTVIATLSTKMTLDASDFTKNIDSLGAKLDNLGARARAIGGTLTTRVTAPIVAGFAGAVWAASDLNETMNKTNVVFGDSADAVIAWSKDSATALGLSQNEALGYASTFGNIFTSLDMTASEAADLSQSVVQLGTDLGSFNNVPTGEALDALRAGLLGEYEPLKRFGIVLTEAEVNAYALSKGLVDANGQVTEAGKVQARQELIAQKAANAQGDFAETSGSLANQMKILKARIANAAASIGQILLPYVTRLVGFIVRLVERFNNLSSRMKTIIVIVLAVAASIGPLLIAFGSLAGAIAMIIKLGPQIKTFAKTVRAAFSSALGPMLLIIAVLAAIYLIWKYDLFGIKTKITKWFDAFKAPGGGLDKLKERFEKLKDAARALALKALPYVGKALQWMKKTLLDLWQRAQPVLGWLKQTAQQAMAGIAVAVDYARGYIHDNLGSLIAAFDGFKTYITEIGKAIAAIFRGDFAEAGTHLQNAFLGALQFFQNLGTFLWPLVQAAIDGIWTVIQTTDWKGLGLEILSWIGVAVDAIGDLAKLLQPYASDLLGGFWNFIRTYDWIGLGKSILGWITEKTITGLTNMYTLLSPYAADLLAGFWDWIKNYDWIGLGKSILMWITDKTVAGITGLYELLKPYAADLAAGFWDFLRTYDWVGLGKSIFGWIKDKTVAAVKGAYQLLRPVAGDLLAGMWDYVRLYDWGGLGVSILNWLKTKTLAGIGSLYGLLEMPARAMVNGFRQTASDTWETVTTWLRGRKDAITGFFDKSGEWLWNAGYNIFYGLYSGLQSIWDNTIKPWIDDKISYIKRIPGVELVMNSPSKLYEDYGMNIMRGLAIGLENGSGLAMAQIDGTVAGIAGASFTSPAVSGAGASSIVINVNGAGDPKAVADHVFAIFSRELGLRGAL